MLRIMPTQGHLFRQGPQPTERLTDILSRIEEARTRTVARIRLAEASIQTAKDVFWSQVAVEISNGARTVDIARYLEVTQNTVRRHTSKWLDKASA